MLRALELLIGVACGIALGKYFKLGHEPLPRLEVPLQEVITYNYIEDIKITRISAQEVLVEGQNGKTFGIYVQEGLESPIWTAQMRSRDCVIVLQARRPGSRDITWYLTPGQALRPIYRIERARFTLKDREEIAPDFVR